MSHAVSICPKVSIIIEATQLVWLYSYSDLHHLNILFVDHFTSVDHIYSTKLFSSDSSHLDRFVFEVLLDQSSEVQSNAIAQISL